MPFELSFEILIKDNNQKIQIEVTFRLNSERKFVLITPLKYQDFTRLFSFSLSSTDTTICQN